MGDNILHFTDLGLQVALNAKASGVLIDAVAYKIGDSDLNHSDADEDIHGNTLIQGTIGFVEVMDKHTARFTMRIGPEKIGVGVIGSEIGIYSHDNLMLGRCVFDVPLELRAGETHELSVLLSTTKCDLTVINVTVGEYSSIPATPNVVTLGHPDESQFNAVAVHDLIENSDNTVSSGIAFKYGSGSLQWGFSGYDRVYSGLPNVGATAQKFTSSGLLGSVAFNSGETVLVYVVAGPARGQTRKFYFSSAEQAFLLKDTSNPFVSFDETCTVVVWKRLGGSGGVNNYPPQMSNIPPDWVLTRGVDNLPVWAPPKNNSKNLNTLYVSPGRLRINALNEVGNGQQARYSLGNILVKDVNYCVTALGGITQHKTAYDISSAELEFAESIPANVPIDFRLFTKEPGSGTYTEVVVDMFTGDGSTTRFRLSQPIEGVQYAMVYIKQLLQATTTYTYNTNTQEIEFISPPPAGLTIEANVFVFRPDEGYATEMISTSMITVGDTLFVELPVKPQTKNHTFVSVSGSHITRDLYSVIDNKIVFSEAVEGNLGIEVLIFNNVLSLGSPQTNLAGVVTDAVMTHKSIKLLRHDAPPIILQMPQINFKNGAGIRIDGEYPNYRVSSTYAEQYTPTTEFKISTRKIEENTTEIIYSQKINITDDIRLMITVDFNAMLGAGFASIDGLEVMEYVIGFRTTGLQEPEYGRRVKGTGTAGFSSLKGVNQSNETAYSQASATQIYDLIKANLPEGYIDLVARMRVANANVGKYESLLTMDINVLSLPMLRTE